MSVEPLQCADCKLTCRYEGVTPFPEGTALSYAVSWQCPRCKERSLDICPLGPLIPTEATCLNCGHAFDAGEDAACPSCGLSRAEADALLLVERLPSDLLNGIRTAFNEGRFRFGLAAVNKALIATPSLEAAWNTKTAFLAALGFSQSLAEVLEHMVKLGIGSATLSYGSLLYREERYDEAVQVYRNFLDDRPNDDLAPSVMANLANGLFAVGKDTEAEQFYRAAIDREPGRATHYINYVLLLKSQGRLDEALECIALGLAASPESEHTTRLLEDRSFFFAEKNRAEDALESIERALRLGAEGIRPRYLHGRALALVGRLQEAREEIQWVLRADPDNKDALRAIGMIDQALQSRSWRLPRLWKRRS